MRTAEQIADGFVGEWAPEWVRDLAVLEARTAQRCDHLGQRIADLMAVASVSRATTGDAAVGRLVCIGVCIAVLIDSETAAEEVTR